MAAVLTKRAPVLVAAVATTPVALNKRAPASAALGAAVLVKRAGGRVGGGSDEPGSARQKGAGGAGAGGAGAGGGAGGAGAGGAGQKGAGAGGGGIGGMGGGGGGGGMRGNVNVSHIGGRSVTVISGPR